GRAVVTGGKTIFSTRASHSAASPAAAQASTSKAPWMRTLLMNRPQPRQGRRIGVREAMRLRPLPRLRGGGGAGGGGACSVPVASPSPTLPRKRGEHALRASGRLISSQFRLELLRPQRLVVPVLERHRHHLRRSIDCHVAEELQVVAERGHELLGGCLLEHELRTERVVERARDERAGMDRAGNELPERLEILELRLAGIVVMRRAVVHVGGQPYGVADAGMLDEREKVGDLELAAARRAVAL